MRTRWLATLTVLLSPIADVATASPMPTLDPATRLLPISWRSARPWHAGSAPGGAHRAAALRAPAACTRDEQCTPSTYCDDKRGVCVPVRRTINALYLYYRSGDRRFTELLGLYWHQRGASGYRLLFPVYWQFWSPEERARVVFPFYYRFEVPSEGTSNLVVPPFQMRSTLSHTSYRVWPLFFYTDSRAQGSALTFLPFLHHQRTPSRRTTLVPLFLTYHRSSADGSTGLLAGLIYWHTTPYRRSGALFPVAYHSHTRDTSFTWVAPLNVHYRSGDRRLLLVPPLFFDYRSEHSTAHLALVPPLYYSRDGRHELELHSPPLLFYSRSGDEGSRRSFLLAGLLFFHRRHHDRVSWGVPPLLFNINAATSSTNVLFPLFWRFAEPTQQTVVVGPFYHHRRGEHLAAGLAPLAFYTRSPRRLDLTLAPLFSYGAQRDGRRRHLYTPLFGWSRDDAASFRAWGAVVPPYYQQRDSKHEIDTLFPLFFRYRDTVARATTLVLGAPVVWHDSPEQRSLVAFPLFWRFNNLRDRESTTLILPLAYRRRESDGSHLTVALPFYYKGRSDGWSGGMLPLLYAGRHGQRRHVIAFPALWHLSSPERHVTVLGPAYLRRDHGRGWLAGVAPLFFAGDRDGDSHQVLFPLFWHLRSRSVGYDTTVAGPVFWSRSQQGRVWGALPFVVDGELHGTRFTAALPPLLVRTASAASGRSFTLAGGLYYRYRRPGYIVDGIFPLARHSRRETPEGQVTRTSVFPLLYRYRSPGKHLLLTPIAAYRSDREQSLVEGIVGPVGWRRRPDLRGVMVMPFFFRWTRPQQRATTTVLWPLWGSHRAPDRSAHVAFPLVWRFRDPGQQTIIAGPLLWRDRGPARTVGLLPVFIHHRAPERGYTILAPLLWRFKDQAQTRSATVVAPLLWHLSGRRRQSSATVVAPIFWHFADHAARGTSTVVAPLLWHAANRTTGSSATVVVPLFGRFVAAERGSVTFAGPVFHRRRHDQQLFGVAPLFWAAWSGRGQHGGCLLPVGCYHRDVARRWLYTAAFGFHLDGQERHLYAGPFYQLRDPDRAVDLLAPLFYRRHNRSSRETALYLFPGYYGRWSPTERAHTFAPLFWRFWRPERHSTVVFPLVWDFGDRSTRTTVVFPLLARHEDHARRTVAYLTPPGIWIKPLAHGTDAVVFPLLWHFSGHERRTTALFPLYWDVQRGNSRTTLVAPPIFWRFDRPDSRTIVVLNTYYSRSKRERTYDLNVIPLVRVQRKRPTDIKFELLAGLFGYERVGLNRYLKLLLIPIELAPARQQTTTALAGGSPRGLEL
jgi:hypothetical protein